MILLILLQVSLYPWDYPSEAACLAHCLEDYATTDGDFSPIKHLYTQFHCLHLVLEIRVIHVPLAPVNVHWHWLSLEVAVD